MTEKSQSLDRRETICKILSKNDTGENDNNQAGLYVPKPMLWFFPPLDIHEYNPRFNGLRFEDESGVEWKFNYIYYNNQRVPNPAKPESFPGTFDEYRITCMTKFIRESFLRAGDRVYFHRTPFELPDLEQNLFNDLPYGSKYHLTVEIERGTKAELKKTDGWKIIRIRESSE